MNKNRRFERAIFKCFITGPKISNEEKIKIANHARFRQNLFMVGDMCRVELKELSNGVSVFTVFNFYYINDLSFFERIRHFLSKIRAAALRKMGISEIVIVVV